ncbi:MAG TPA: TIGR03435 family protein, partial [Verrucomicrobiae bacterium]|nr:TIGR03435 family protein [Verrucomicrobiae bacterium]
VSIRRAKPSPRFGTAWISDGRKQMAFNKSVSKLLQNAYQIREPRIVYSGKPPEGTYDYIVTVPDHQLQALQAAIKKKFGLVGRKETRDADVLVLRVARKNAPGIKPTPEPRAINLNNASAGQFIIRNEPMANISHSLELYLKTPLIDKTGLTGRYDVELTWDATEQDYNPEGMRQAILDQLGLELVSDHQTIEMLVVEKAK